MPLNRRELLAQGGTAAALGAGGLASAASAQAPQAPTQWHHEADVVVIGSGACGLPAAIAAKEAGSSVIVVEAQPHVGGHARVSGGNVPLGGGTSVQKKYGIEDSPDLVFKDLTDWSVVQPNGFPDYRYNDREVIVVANHPSNERHRASHWQVKLAAEKRWKCRFCRAILSFATETS
jgi:choline dehydrogenase-like flavoprotein